MLTMLAGFDVQSLFAKQPAIGLHLLAEVMKRAMADRAYWLAIPTLPKSRVLCSIRNTWPRGQRRSICSGTTEGVAGHGMPPRSTEDLFAPGKLHDASDHRR